MSEENPRTVIRPRDLDREVMAWFAGILYIVYTGIHTLGGGVEYALRMAPRRAHALLCTWAAFRLGPAADEADADEQDATIRVPRVDDGDLIG